MSATTRMGGKLRASAKHPDTLTLLAGIAFLGSLLPFLELLRYWRENVPLAERVSEAGGPAFAYPRLSVIVPALNEAEKIRTGIASILAQNYPDLELVLVNDRSTDRTGEIMEELARGSGGRARVVHVRELPPGWLGKNHALQLGARHASGDWLLFTDADIVFDPSCMALAVAYAEAEGLDHLALGPAIPARGYWLTGFVCFFIWAFLTSQRPYKANDPRSNVGVGIGAFNLIRTSAYEAIGSHDAISLRPDDDVRLGMRVKLSGLRQQVLSGGELLKVDWYPSLRSAIQGLEKNAFAGLCYSLPRVVAALGVLTLITVFPYLCLTLARGRTRLLFGAGIAIHLTHFAYVNRRTGRQVAIFLPAFPLLSLLFSYTVLRAVWLTLRQGGIAWRGTHYTLAELRGQTGLEGLDGR